MTMHDGKETRVREIAYMLWERDGYPDGASERHWFEAEALYEAEDAERKATEGEPPGDAAESTLVATAPAKPAPASPASKAKVAAKRAETITESASAKAPATPKRKS